MQKLAPGFSERKSKQTGNVTSILAVLRFVKPFERDVFRFNPFSSFRETTFVRVYWNAILVSRHGMAPQVNESCKEMRRLIFEVDIKINSQQIISGPVL